MSIDFEKIESAAVKDETKAERDTETLLTLGGSLNVNGVNLPPPTTAVLSLLEIIDSPFLMLSGKATLRQVIETLYILREREKAVASLLRYSRARRMIEETAGIALKSPEFYEKYLKSIEAARKDMDEFDVNASRFGESLGIFDIAKVATEIRDYIYSSMGGFELIPDKDEESDKKKEPLTANGSPR